MHKVYLLPSSAAGASLPDAHEHTLPFRALQLLPNNKNKVLLFQSPGARVGIVFTLE